MINIKSALKILSLTAVISAAMTINIYAAINENEPNNTISQAHILDQDFNMNELIIGSVEDNAEDRTEDYFAFIPKESGTYNIICSDKSFELLDSNQEVIDRTMRPYKPNGDYSNMIGDLTANQTYYIKRKAEDCLTGTYNFKITPIQPKVISSNEMEYNSSFLVANILPNSQKEFSVNCSINQAGDEDFFIFKPKISGTYTFETIGEIDSVGYLYDNTGISDGIMQPEKKMPIAENDDSDGTRNFKITYNLNASNTYYIKVCDYFNTVDSGNYTLKVSIPQEQISNDTEGSLFTNALPLSTTEIRTSQMNSFSDIDYYTFSAPASGWYRIETKSFGNTTGQVFDINKNLLINDTDNNDNVVLELYCKANTAYYIRIYDKLGYIGDYSISISRSKVLSVPNQSQQPYQRLCWATTASMIVSYMANNNINLTTDIANPNNNIPSLINMPQDVYYVEKGVQKYFPDYFGKNIDTFKTNTTIFGNVPFADVSKVIDLNMPMAGLIEGHWVTIKGYSTCIEGKIGEFIIYNDPWDNLEHYTDRLGNFDNIVYYLQNVSSNIEQEVNESIYSSNLIGLDTEIQGAIDTEGDVDFYQVGVSQGDYVVETFGETDTFGEVYIADQSSITFVGQDNNSGAYGNFKIDLSVSGKESRTLYIKVKHTSPKITGNYSLKVTKK